MIDDRQQPADSLEDEDETKSSKVLLAAIREAQEAFAPYLDQCKVIDDYYSRMATKYRSLDQFSDPDFDLFWASQEILKPAIYAKPPRPLASPMFDDRDPVVTAAADMLERSLSSSFKREAYDEVMLGTRDDLAMHNRGVQWLRYESKGGQRVCYEEKDRTDFVHDLARKWRDVGWVAGRAWMTLDQMKARFTKVPLDVLMLADVPDRRVDIDNGSVDTSRRSGVWEVWSKTDNRVYWVVEGVDTILDEREPILDLQRFFPCPRPAYGTIRPRSLMPIPDFLRYASLLEQVDDLTGRIYELLDEVRLRGFYNGSSDRGAAINKLFNDRSRMMQLVGLDAGLMQGSGGDPIQWLPLAEIATTITGLIEARAALIQDYYQLSGISDIMRGATEAQETLGAQRLKQQNGSVRVRDKQQELERIAADAAGIAAEIMAENFSEETFLDYSQMDIRKRSEIQKDIKDAEKSARKELEDLNAQAEEMAQQAMASGQQPDPEQAQQAEAQFNEAQQAIIAKYQPALADLAKEVAIEDVMKLLRDSRARNFVIEIETDSTILTDQLAAQQSASEFYTAFTGGLQGLVGVAALGPEAVKMSTEVFKMTIAPYRPTRRVMTAIDDFVDAAPEVAERMQAQASQGGEDQQAMAQLAQAELMKAQAQGQNYQAQAELKAAELQMKTQEAGAKLQQDQQRFALEVEETRGSIAKDAASVQKTMADIQKIGAEIQLAQQKLGLEAHREEREDVKLAVDVQQRQTDTAMAMQEKQTDAAFRAQEGQRADRQQEFSERSGDRKMTLAERQAQQQAKGKE